MDQVDRLRKPSAALFWALGIVCTYLRQQHLTLPAAQHHSCTAVHKACPYMVIVIVGSILNEDGLSPPLPI